MHKKTNFLHEPKQKKKEWENIYELWVGISNIFFLNLPDHKNECGDGEGV